MTEFKKINWLYSYPKSGNTWVRLLFDAYFRGELDINEILCSVGDDGIQRYDLGDKSPIGNWPIDIQQLMRPAAMLRTVTSYNAVDLDIPLIVKTHQANVIANGIELLPAALTRSTILLVRDPRDVMPSFANHLGLDHDEATAVMENKSQVLAAKEHRISDYLGRWDDHVESCLAANEHNVMMVRYEDLRENPDSWFWKMLEHVGVKPDEARVQKSVEMTELSRLRKLEKEKGFGEGSAKAKDPFFNTGEVGKKISAGHKSRIERAFRKTMVRLGYTGKRSGVINLH